MTYPNEHLRTLPQPYNMILSLPRLGGLFRFNDRRNTVEIWFNDKTRSRFKNLVSQQAELRRHLINMSVYGRTQLELFYDNVNVGDTAVERINFDNNPFFEPESNDYYVGKIVITGYHHVNSNASDELVKSEVLRYKKEA